VKTSNGKWLSLFILQCSLFNVQFCCHADPLAENQARFGVITGDVGLLTQGALEWIEPHEGLPLEVGDHIRTGEDGRVELIMSDNAVWVLEPESDVIAEHMETNVGRLNLSSGTLMGRLDSARAAGIPQSWEFNTPAFVIAVRGTEFALQASQAAGSRLAVFEGEVELAPAETAEGLQPPFRVTAGQEALLKRGKAVHTSSQFSPAMKIMAGKMPGLLIRQTQN
jgi:hypothetical protein